ncbi:unnamed protein product [Acanthosepion pharaonis]|uniref:Uncharacterized protein n=1 Tax=Acanthosepion pharaonis TaxID=158019 RepID=A0A812D252_ACAPH|nr:unnamed protein product [Sepia pharaonis]
MKHNFARLFVIGSTVLLFVVVLALSALAGNANAKAGVFDQTIGEVSAKYDTNITPASATFAIWGIIYMWQVLWLLYGIIQICRSHLQNYLYIFPPTLPTGLYLSFAFNNICVIIWLFVWTKEIMIAALVFLVLATFSLYVALYFSFSTLYKFLGLLYKEELNADVWLVRILVQNGIAFYATWISIASLLNLNITLSDFLFHTSLSFLNIKQTFSLDLLDYHFSLFLIICLSLFSLFLIICLSLFSLFLIICLFLSLSSCHLFSLPCHLSLSFLSLPYHLSRLSFSLSSFLSLVSLFLSSLFFLVICLSLFSLFLVICLSLFTLFLIICLFSLSFLSLVSLFLSLPCLDLFSLFLVICLSLFSLFFITCLSLFSLPYNLSVLEMHGQEIY